MAEKTKREFVVERHAVTDLVLYEVTGEDLEQLERETLTVGEDFFVCPGGYLNRIIIHGRTEYS
jgi:hypothetical protein